MSREEHGIACFVTTIGRADRTKNAKEVSKKREAKEYEERFMYTTEADMNMKVGAFVETYFRDKQGELKKRSIKDKR